MLACLYVWPGFEHNSMMRPNHELQLQWKKKNNNNLAVVVLLRCLFTLFFISRKHKVNGCWKVCTSVYPLKKKRIISIKALQNSTLYKAVFTFIIHSFWPFQIPIISDWRLQMALTPHLRELDSPWLPLYRFGLMP